MKSIINAQPPSISIFPRSDVKSHFTSNKPFWLPKGKFSRREGAGSGSWFLQIHERNRVHSLPARVDPTALLLAATTAPKSADISVLLPTSAVMLFVYWIANFALPELIMKDIQSDKTKTDGKDDENLSDNGQGSIK